MTPSIGDQGLDGDPAYESGENGDGEGKDLEPLAKPGPDPVIGAGITLLGIFLMGTGGARDAHYLFDVGVLVAVLGAAIFVLFVALSAMKLRSAEKPSDGDDAPGESS